MVFKPLDADEKHAATSSSLAQSFEHGDTDPASTHGVAATDK